jgi:hypothetical protein
MPDEWAALVARYADDRKICNCRAAYYALGPGDQGFCQYGCSANQLCARDEIARRVLEELSELDSIDREWDLDRNG